MRAGSVENVRNQRNDSLENNNLGETTPQQHQASVVDILTRVIFHCSSAVFVELSSQASICLKQSLFYSKPTTLDITMGHTRDIFFPFFFFFFFFAAF